MRPTNGVEPPSPRELLEQTQRVREDLSALLGAAKYLARGWRDVVSERLAEQPYATLAVAVGVGYVLGGGIPTAVVRTLAGLGGRVALERALSHYATSLTPGR